MATTVCACRAVTSRRTNDGRVTLPREPIATDGDGRVPGSADQRGRRGRPESRRYRGAGVPEQVDELPARLAEALLRPEKRHVAVLQVRVGDRVRMPWRDKSAESHRQGNGS